MCIQTCITDFFYFIQDTLLELLQEVSNLNEKLSRTSSISVSETLQSYLIAGVDKSYAMVRASLLKVDGKAEPMRYHSDVVGFLKG